MSSVNPVKRTILFVLKSSESQSGLLQLECTCISMQHYLSRPPCSLSNFNRPRLQLPPVFVNEATKGSLILDFQNCR